MPSKEHRKVIKLGASKVISLPKPFLDYHRVEEGDKVLLLYDSIVLVMPDNISKRKMRAKDKLIRELLE